MRALKAVRLLSLLPKHPVEVLRPRDDGYTGEQGTQAEQHPEDCQFVDALNLALGVSIGGITKILAENELHNIEKNVSDCDHKLKGSGPFDLGHCGDFCSRDRFM